MTLRQDIEKRKKILIQIIQRLKTIRDLKPKNETQRVALQLAAKNGQVVYGSSVTGMYSRNIKPKDIDISSKSPLKAAKELQLELLKRKLKAEIKKKYIPQLKRNIYEVESISYSPLSSTKLKGSEEYKQLRISKLAKEVGALAGTISDKKKYYRVMKDYDRLMQLKKRIATKKEKILFTQAVAELKKQGENYFMNVLKEKPKWL